MRPTIGPRLTIGLKRSPPPAVVRSGLSTIGPWEIVREAHLGAMFRISQVRPAEHRGEGRGVAPAAYALKELLPRWDHVSAASELLRREVTLGRSLSHPHLVAVLSAQLHEAPRYVVMPWLAGESLAKIVQRGPLAPARAIWITRQIAEALASIHAAGWLHGDVKPENVLVGPQGHATLLDLGFARQMGERTTSFDECLCFTAAYAAPEQVSARPTDARTDLYSLGVSLYEMLSGALPFAAETVTETLRLHKEERPPDLRSRAPHVSDELCQLVQRLLAKDPLRRIASAQELVSVLIDLEIALFDER